MKKLIAAGADLDEYSHVRTQLTVEDSTTDPFALMTLHSVQEGYTALWVSCEEGDHQAVALLIEAGASCDGQPVRCDSPRALRAWGGQALPRPLPRALRAKKGIDYE